MRGQAAAIIGLAHRQGEGQVSPSLRLRLRAWQHGSLDHLGVLAYALLQPQANVLGKQLGV